MKPEVLKSWSLEIDYSRAPCLGADQKARGLWERDCSSGFLLSDQLRMCKGTDFRCGKNAKFPAVGKEIHTQIVRHVKEIGFSFIGHVTMGVA